MAGGPSQMDTFSLKPGHANGGPFKPIATKAPGVEFSEHLPKLANVADRLAVIRSMTTKEGDHGRATTFLRTGYQPMEPVQFPTLGALIAKELGDTREALPSFVSMGGGRRGGANAGAGYLGPQFAPLIVGNADGDGAAPVATR